jgi:glycerate-2-kinase
VRKHLSAIKGGRLAAAAGATVTLAISDVVAPVADDPCVIGSGPTVPDPTTFADALAALDRFALRGRVPPAVVALLERGAGGEVEETIKAGDARLARASFHVIGSRLDALAGARERAAALGYTVVEVPEPIVGEAREAGAWLARRAAAAGAPRVCVLAAGETTVRVRGRGRGGRNQELALAAALEGPGTGGGWVLASAGTDGVDGPTDAAGAIVDPTTLARAAAAGLDPRRFLENNDVYRFFEPLGDLIRTGPTGTNVGDVQVVLFG